MKLCKMAFNISRFPFRNNFLLDLNDEFKLFLNSEKIFSLVFQFISGGQNAPTRVKSPFVAGTSSTLEQEASSSEADSICTLYSPAVSSNTLQNLFPKQKKKQNSTIIAGCCASTT